MKRMFLAATLALVSCGPEELDAPDAGSLLAVDAGTATDAGAAMDAGMDGGMVNDAGVTTDAGTGCARVSSRVGWSATLSTRAHGVRGRVTMTDACTLTLSEFHYDGQGIDVRLYGASAGQGFAQGAGLGPQLYRPQQPWVNETLTIELPATVTLEQLDRVSVWCIAASVDFGSGTFAP